MLTLLWNLSAAIRGYLRFHMPTNRAVDWLRSPRGLKWAIPVALAATPGYLGLTALSIHLAAGPGLGWLNVLVFLFSWNAIKFAVLGALTPLRWLVDVGGAVAHRIERDGVPATVEVPERRHLA